MNGAKVDVFSHGRMAGEEQSRMPLMRNLRRSLAYLLLTLSIVYLFGNQVAQILSLPRGSDLAAASTSSESPWNLFYHLGGNGPWIPKRTDDGSAADPLPDACVVDQVHMMSRHGERYPTKNAGTRHLQLLDRLKTPGTKLTGALEFLNEWTYFTSPEDPSFEDLTRDGPYAGTKQAEDTGRKLRARYGHLDLARRVRFWSCSSKRDVETARCFADGFFGPDWEGKAADLEIIPEEADRGGDTLTPGDTCLKYVEDLEEGHDKGYGKLEEWQKHFTRPIAERLSSDAAGLSLSHLDIYSMMEMCGFETLARGFSPWCDIFTHAEWRQFEYGRDLLHFYRAGPGNKFSRPMGWLYLNATADLLQNTSSRDVYFSFVHDGDIVPLLAALRIFDEPGKQELPSDQLQLERHWKTSDVVPMGGRILFERIACNGSDTMPERYVRLSVNEGIIHLPGLVVSERVPSAYLVEDFWKFVSDMLLEYGEFAEVCGLPDSAASRISFLHQ